MAVEMYPLFYGLLGYGGSLFSVAVENVPPPPSTYLPSSTFEINEYYLSNIIITSI